MESENFVKSSKENNLELYRALYCTKPSWEIGLTELNRPGLIEVNWPD